MVSQIQNANGVTWVQGVDPKNMARPSRFSASGNDVTWDTGTYLYDGSGNVKTKGADSYVYDSAGRILQGTVYAVGNAWQRYAYDSFGNITTTEKWLNNAQSEPPRSTPTDPSTNHMQGNGASYDVAGNLSTWQGWTYVNQTYTYSYDPLNNMTMLVGNAAPGYQKDWTYFYTADDERIWQYNNVTKRSRYRVRGVDNKPLREFTRDGYDLNQPQGAQGTWTWPEDWIWRDGTVLAANQPLRKVWFHLDHIGTTKVVSTNTGPGRYDTRHYYPFGEEATAADSGPGDFIRFTGHERDVMPFERNSLDYMHAPYYDSLQGRFLSVDSHPGKPTVPQSWNRYAYARNNPVKFIDPDGQDAMLFIVAHAGAFSAWGHSAIYVTRSGKGEGISYLGAFGFGKPGLPPQKAIDAFVRGYTSMGRGVTVYTLKTTPAEDAKMMAFIAANRELGGTHPSLVPQSLEFRENCTTACYNVLRSGGLLSSFFNPEGFGAHTPDELEAALKDPESELGERVYNVTHYPGAQSSFTYPTTDGLALLFGGSFWVEGVPINMAPPK